MERRRIKGGSAKERKKSPERGGHSDHPIEKQLLLKEGRKAARPSEQRKTMLELGTKIRMGGVEGGLNSSKSHRWQ